MKRILTLLASLALVASGLHILPASAAEEAPAVPDVANIEDPVQDANFLNSGTAGPLGQDNVTPTDASGVADLIKVWFTNDPDKVSVHFLTQVALPGTNGVTFQAFASPGEGGAGSSTVGCLRFVGVIPGSGPGGGSYQGPPFIRLVDRCNVGTSIFADSVEGEFVISPGPDDGGILTLTFPRSYSPLLASGSSLTAPTAQTSSPTVGHADVGFTTSSTDNTKVGTDYVLQEGGATKPTKPAKPAKPAKPETPVKKGCDNGKGKKKGCAKTPKPKACTPFTPGEAGAEKPLVTLTDAATEAKPVEQTITIDESVADLDLLGTGAIAATHDAFNIQVDSAAADAGLYVLLEFPSRRDYDLNLLHPDGSFAARSRSFNPVIGTPGEMFSDPGHGGEGSASSEKLVGVRTSDCGGWTLDVANYLGEGGEMTVKLWLGEAKIDPQAAGEETP